MISGGSLVAFLPDGSSVSVRTIEDIVREKLKFLLQANKGDIPDDLTYGCDLIHFVHTPLDDMMVLSMRTIIEMEVSQRMSYVRITRVEANRSEAGFLQVTVFYELQAGYEDSVSVTL